MARQLRSLGLIGLLGGVGGAINAWLCYARVPTETGYTDFSWHIIPAGACHGGLLAVVAAGCAVLLRRQKALVRWMALPVVGWLSGWLSWIPLRLSISP